jgi:hypothetical protein
MKTVQIYESILITNFAAHHKNIYSSRDNVLTSAKNGSEGRLGGPLPVWMLWGEALLCTPAGYKTQIPSCSLHTIVSK